MVGWTGCRDELNPLHHTGDGGEFLRYMPPMDGAVESTRQPDVTLDRS
jgi:hypothetical protein